VVFPTPFRSIDARLNGLPYCNEFIAYLDLIELVKKQQAISERSQIISTYALCGFSNIGSIGIQIGGIDAIAPLRQGDLAKLGVRAMIAGLFGLFYDCLYCRDADLKILSFELRNLVRSAHPTVNVIKEKLKKTQNYLTCGKDLIIFEAGQWILAIGYY
jgi:Na+ dependent nucleoside transporter C-terminus